MGLKTAKEVQYLIEIVFEVTYSIRQVESIMKKLDYTYTKPYPIYAEMLDNVKLLLKKTQNL